MPKYLIQREVPNAGKLTADEIQAISRKSNDVLRAMRDEGKEIQWVQSYVTDKAIHCVYIASGEGLVREHARRGGFPADQVTQVRAVADPTTGE